MEKTPPPKFLNYKNSKIFYDTAPTGNAKCYFCRKFIPKGVPRMWFWDKQWVKTEGHKKIAVTLIPPKKLTALPNVQQINVTRKICHRCMKKDIFDSLTFLHKEEIKKIKKLQKNFFRTLNGKRCKIAIETEKALEELGTEPKKNNYI
jgi:hypothetical protein